MSERKRLTLLSSINEQELYSLLQKSIPDLHKTDEYHYSDCVSSSQGLIIELKCRRVHYDELIIEQSKYSKLISSNYKNVRYINSTPKGIYSFDLRQIEEPNWISKHCKRTTDFSNNSYVAKQVGLLHISLSKDITDMLLSFTSY